MTCFWDSIRGALDLRLTASQFVSDLQSRNVRTSNVKWNGYSLTDRHCEENIAAIACLDPATLHDGYLCSGFDPVLFLVAELYQVTIHHSNDGTNIVYAHDNPRDAIYLTNNSGHMWIDRRANDALRNS